MEGGGVASTPPPLYARGLTLSLPRLPKIKIQDKSQISFCKIFKYK